jgi:hypothetical protein
MKDVRLHEIPVSFSFMSTCANSLPLLLSQIKMADTAAMDTAVFSPVYR